MNHPCSSSPLSSPRVRVLLVLGILVSFTIPIFAHDPQHRPDIDAWMKGLQNQQSQICCAGNDATMAAAAWDMKSNHYIVEIDMDGTPGWYEVPDGALVTGPNLAGHALVWWYVVSCQEQEDKDGRCYSVDVPKMPGRWQQGHDASQGWR